MVNFANVLDVIEKEKRLSCSDGAVFGGFAQWLFRLTEDVEDPALKQLAASYQQTAPAKRPELLLQIESLILRRQQGAQAEAQPVPAVKSDGVTAPRYG